MRECDEDAFTLISVAQDQLKEIERRYGEALYACAVPKDYLVLYKNFLENLRSALDYTARSLVERFGKVSNPKQNVYFPYVPNSDMKISSYKGRKFDQKMPGVNENRKDIEEFILNLSDYENGMRWFLEFMRITNKKKHVQLVRQDVEEFVSLDYGGLSLHASGGISFSATGAIQSDSGSLNGPFSVEPGKTIYDDKGKPVIPGRDRELIIRDHWIGDNAVDFASQCQSVIGDVVDRLVSDPVKLH